MWTNVHPVYCAGIRTHDLQGMSLLPLHLDQGSRPKILIPYMNMAVSGAKASSWPSINVKSFWAADYR